MRWLRLLRIVRDCGATRARKKISFESPDAWECEERGYGVEGDGIAAIGLVPDDYVAEGGQ